MGSFLKKFNFVFYVFLTFFTSLVFFEACSQSAPELFSTNYSVVFEYEKPEEYPSARLSVFVESESDVRRYSRVKITSQDTGYIWDFDSISLIENENRQWAGNTNLVVPDSEMIPSGTYEVVFYNADEKNDSMTFSVTYDSTCYDLTGEEIEDYMKKKNAVCKIAIYDKDEAMLYYGEKIKDFETVRGIWNFYRRADTFQDIWYSAGNREICIMPLQKVELETADN